MTRPIRTEISVRRWSLRRSLKSWLGLISFCWLDIWKVWTLLSFGIVFEAREYHLYSTSNHYRCWTNRSNGTIKLAPIVFDESGSLLIILILQSMGAEQEVFLLDRIICWFQKINKLATNPTFTFKALCRKPLGWLVSSRCQKCFVPK